MPELRIPPIDRLKSFSFEARGKHWILTPSNHPGNVQKPGKEPQRFDRWLIAVCTENGDDQVIVAQRALSNVWDTEAAIEDGFLGRTSEEDGDLLSALAEAAALRK